MSRVPVQRIDHVMVPVRDLEGARQDYEALFGTRFHELRDESLSAAGGGRTLLAPEGIQLVEVRGGELARFAQRAGENAIGMALRVPDVDEAESVFLSAGSKPVGRCRSAGWRAVAFDASSTCGAIVKLVEYLPNYTVADLEVVNLWREAKGAEVPHRGPGPRIRARGIDHVLFYVNDITSAQKAFTDRLRTRFPRAHQGVVSDSSLSVDGIGIELISGPRGAGIASFIASRTGDGATGEGIFGVSFRVDDYREAVRALSERGIEPIATRDLPTRQVALYRPSPRLGLGLEIIEYRPLAHPLACLEMVEDIRATRRDE